MSSDRRERSRTGRARGRELLREMLASGYGGGDGRVRRGRAPGIAVATLKRTKKAMGVRPSVSAGWQKGAVVLELAESVRAAVTGSQHALDAAKAIRCSPLALIP